MESDDSPGTRGTRAKVAPSAAAAGQRATVVGAGIETLLGRPEPTDGRVPEVTEPTGPPERLRSNFFNGIKRMPVRVSLR